MPVALLDVNVLVALFDPDHLHHDLAHDWFAVEGRDGWATCSITENGFLRVLSHPNYRPEPIRLADALAGLRKFCSGPRHRFWPADISLADESLFASAAFAGHRQITDVYLLGLAKKMGGRLATFDRSIPLAAVKGARRSHLAVISPA
ncbi:MAG TPA: TA system VapC family ribonuclease toxin [Vicinamibacterales bacterium]|nr:TA system VapC family ribonuclease toxin [Vicinamibacterales bacterium]